MREPLNPTEPELPQEMVLPSGSEIVTIVLLKDDLMCATACAMFFFSLRRVLPLGFANAYSFLVLPDFFLPGDGLARTFARARISVSALPSHRKTATMP